MVGEQKIHVGVDVVQLVELAVVKDVKYTQVRILPFTLRKRKHNLMSGICLLLVHDNKYVQSCLIFVMTESVIFLKINSLIFKPYSLKRNYHHKTTKG